MSIPIHITASVVSLGSCATFAVLAGTTLTFGSGQTVITNGSIGVSPGTTAVSGNYSLTSGSTYLNTAKAISCASDLATAYTTASTVTCDHAGTSSDLSGLTLKTGVYCSANGKFSIGNLKSLTLDAVNVTGVTWIFQTTTTLTASASSSILFHNGALSENLYWAIGSSVSIEYDSFFAGTILATSSISIAAYVKLDGRVLSKEAVTFAGYSTATLPYGTSVVIYPAFHLYLGSCSAFATLSGGSTTFSGDLTIIKSGSVGATGAISGNYRIDSGTKEYMTTSVTSCQTDAAFARSIANTATFTTLTASDLAGKTLTAGLYFYASLGISVSGTLTLDAQNEADAFWLFKTSTTIIAGAHTSVVLINDAQLENVWWYSGTSTTVGTSSNFAGMIIATKAVTFGQRSVLQGRALTLEEITVSDGSQILPSYTFISGLIDLGNCIDIIALAGTSIDFVGIATTIPVGSIGTSPNGYISGPTLYTLEDGSAYINTEPANICKTDFTTG
jgi:hypothetical protein